MTQTPMQKAVEAGRKAVVNAPEKCPIGIPPESHIFCSAGYCATCAEHRMSLALTAALASLEADGWKLMPREATEGMSHGGAVSLEHPTVRMEGPSAHNKRRAARVYEAMFNAAPEVD